MQVLNCCWCLVSFVQLFCNCKPSVSLSIGFPKQEYWSGLTFPSAGVFLNQGSNSHLLHWLVDSLPLGHQGSHVLNKCSICYVKSISFPRMIILASAARSPAFMYIIICFVIKYRIQYSVSIPQFAKCWQRFIKALYHRPNKLCEFWHRIYCKSIHVINNMLGLILILVLIKLQILL